MQQVFIGIGSNLGARQAHILKALAQLNQLPSTEIKASSQWFINPPLGLKHQSAYINGVVLIQTSLPPLVLLKQLKKIEKRIGRKQKRKRWGPRVIDLDILLYDKKSLRHKNLCIPHPQLWLRSFTLIPLLSLSEWVPEQWQPNLMASAKKISAHGLKRVPMPGLRGQTLTQYCQSNT